MPKLDRPRPQDGPHDVLQPIIYRKPNSPHTGQLILPGQLPLPFDHLDEAAYELLTKKRVIAPAQPEPKA